MHHGHGHAGLSRRAFASSLIPGAILTSGAFAQSSGIRAADLAGREKTRLLDRRISTSATWTTATRGCMDKVKRHIDETCFAWVGGSGPESVFYYRIPRICCGSII